MTKITLSDVSVDDAKHIAHYIEVPAMQHNPLRQIMFPSKDRLSFEQKEEIVLWYTNMLEEAFTDRWESFLKATDTDGTVCGYCGWTVEDKKHPKVAEFTRKNSQEDTKQKSPADVKRRNWTPETLDAEAWVALSQALRAERERILENLDKICRQFGY
jgi:hypothetical protein